MKGILIELKDGGETVRHFKIDWIWYLPKGFVQLTCLSAAVFSLDQIWKKRINREKEENFPKKLKGTKGIIEIRKAYNPGFSMGKLEKYPKFVGFVSIFATGFLFLVYLISAILLKTIFCCKKSEQPSSWAEPVPILLTG